MNILTISTWYPYPPDNGSRQRAYYLLQALARRHQVTLVSFRPPELAGSVPEVSPEQAAPVDIVPVPVDPYRYVGLPQAIKFLSPLPMCYYGSRLMAQEVSRLAARCRWDAVVCIQAPAGRYALQLPAVPRLLDVDTALSYQLRAESAAAVSVARRLRVWVSYQKARAYERRLFRRFHACTVVSQAELAHLAAMLRGSLTAGRLVPNGVDCERNRPGRYPTQPATIVYNGALTYGANYDAMRFFLSEVYPTIRRRLPAARLTITGSTAGVDLSGLPIDDSVCLTGWVDDVRPLVGSAAVCTVPLRQGGGTRLKILEAMALGVPVVSTAKGAEGLDVRDGEHLLLADEPDNFAQAVLRVLGDPDLGRRLVGQARSLVEQRYDWERVGQDFVDILEEVAQAGESGASPGAVP